METSETRAAAPAAKPLGIVGLIDTLNAWASHVAHVVLWVLSAVVLYDVLARSVGYPTVWGSELSVYLMLAIAFLGAGHTYGEGGHFRVTLLVDLLGPRGERLCDAICTLVALGFTVAFTYGAFKLAAFSFQLGFRTPTVMQMPVGLLQGVVFVGGLFLALALLQDLVRIARGEPRRHHSEITPE